MTTAPETGTVGAPTDAAALVRRLRRVEGQVAGLVRMVEIGRDCGEILTQLSAAAHALDRVGYLLVATELRGCATGPAETSEKLAAVEALLLRLGR